MSWQELPCRQFCNARARGCEPGACRNPYDREDPRRWLGRGSEPVPGKPFGWAHNMQERAVFDHLRRRGLNPLSGEVYLYSRRLISRLERDYHRRKPRMSASRVGKWKSSTIFSEPELERLVELFAVANDPVTRSIAGKAAEMLEARR